MKYQVDVRLSEAGEFVASCEELGLSRTGLSSACALDALRMAIRYQLELCPCSSVEDKLIELELAT